MSRLENESGPVEWAEMHPDNFPSREFARRVVDRNACRLDATEIIGPCAIDGCTNRAFRPVGSNDPMVCCDCRDEIDALAHPAPPLLSWSRVWWPATLAVVAVLAVVVGLCLVYGVVS